MTYTIQSLSESTNGEPIIVSGVDTAAAVLVHTAIDNAGDFDEVELFANNTSNSSVDVTIEVAGAEQTNLITRTIPSKTTKLVLEGVFLDGGMTVKAFASTADVVNVYGKVGRTV